MINQGRATQHLDPDLQRIAGALTENSRVKIKVVKSSNRCRDRLRECVARKIAAGAERGGMRRAGCTFGVVRHLLADCPPANRTVSTERTCFEIPIG